MINLPFTIKKFINFIITNLKIDMYVYNYILIYMSIYNGQFTNNI